MVALTDAFARSLQACGGTVSEVAPDGVVDALISVVGAGGRVTVTPELSTVAVDLEARGVAVGVGHGASGRSDTTEHGLLDATASVTRALAGVARSGTVVVGPGGGNGGLLASLVPLHVAILDERDIVDSLAEAVAVVARRFDELGGEAMFVSGPSRTADIEMMSVLGVHGPLALHVLIVSGGGA